MTARLVETSMSERGDTATSAPRGLPSGELGAWRGFVQLMQRLPAALECQLQRDSQLSFVEYYVLAMLSDAPDRRIRMSQLALMVNSELSRLSHLVKRLQGRGLVRRESDPEDGRYTHAILTDDGYAHLAAAAPGHVGRVQDLFVGALTTHELQTLRRCADKVIERIDGASDPDDGAQH